MVTSLRLEKAYLYRQVTRQAFLFSLIVPTYVGKQCNQEVTTKKQQAQNFVCIHCTTSLLFQVREAFHLAQHGCPM